MLKNVYVIVQDTMDDWILHQVHTSWDNALDTIRATYAKLNIVSFAIGDIYKDGDVNVRDVNISYDSEGFRYGLDFMIYEMAMMDFVTTL